MLGILHSKTVQPNNDMFRMVGQGYLPHPEQGIDIIAIVLCTIVILGFLILSLRSRDEKKKYGFQVASPVSFICKTGAICLAIIGVFVIWMKDRGVPFPILLLCLIVVAMTVLSTKAPFGKHVFAIGGNRDAARLSGINVKKTTAFVFVIAGFMTAIAGVVYTSRLNSAAISGGQGNELDIITACIIGGTSTMGGVGSIPGSILGALIIATLENGMSLMSLDSFSKYLVKGLVLLFAVVFDSLNRGKKGS